MEGAGCPRTSGYVVERGELAADRFGVEVLDVVEDGESFIPGVTGGVGVAGGVVCVSEVGEDFGLVVVVAELSVQRECLLLAGDRLGVLAEVMVGVAEAFPCLGQSVVVAEVLEHGKARWQEMRACW